MSFTGFRGPFQSFMQKDFIVSHPIDMSTFTADVQPDGTWNILNIQSTEAGGQVLETQNVTKCAAMICNPKLCNVLCSSCLRFLCFFLRNIFGLASATLKKLKSMKTPPF